MRGRCFDVGGNHWKSRRRYDGDPKATVFFRGFEGEVELLGSCLWDFFIETNHYTKKQRLLMKHQVTGIFAGCEYKDGCNFFVLDTISQSKAWVEKAVDRSITIYSRPPLEDFSLQELLDEALRRQTIALPPKPKPKRPTAEILSIVDRLKDNAA